MEFTKKIKTDWLNALKSGKYNKGRFSLKRVNDNVIQHCCLGVLCEVIPELSISPAGYNVVENNQITDGYLPLSKLLGRHHINNLYTINDRYNNDNYSHVIPLIEAIPTVD